MKRFFLLLCLTLVSVDIAAGNHTVTFTSPDPGQGFLVGSTVQIVGEYQNGTPVTAVPTGHFRFSHWSGDVYSTANPYAPESVARDMNIQANFTGKPCTLNFTPGDHGSLSGITVQSIEYGTLSEPVTAVPDTDYSFAYWTDLDTGDILSIENPCQITASDSLNIQAVFTDKILWTVQFKSGTHGTLSGTVFQIIEDSSKTTSITAIPDPGYIFSGWTGSIFSKENPLSVSDVKKDMAVKANFVRDSEKKLISVSSLPVSGGSVFPAGSMAATTGETVVFTWSANPGYVYTGFTIIPETAASVTSTDSGSTTVQVDDDASIVFTFKPENQNLEVTAMRLNIRGKDRDSIRLIGKIDFDSANDILSLQIGNSKTVYAAGGWADGERYGSSRNYSAIYKNGIANFRVSQTSIGEISTNGPDITLSVNGSPLTCSVPISNRTATWSWSGDTDSGLSSVRIRLSVSPGKERYSFSINGVAQNIESVTINGISWDSKEFTITGNMLKISMSDDKKERGKLLPLKEDLLIQTTGPNGSQEETITAKLIQTIRK